MSKPEDDKAIRKKNTEIVVDALKTLQSATLNDVIKYISATQEVDPAQIKEPVKIVLDKGVKYGYVHKEGLKYSIDDAASSGETEEEGDNPCCCPKKKRRRRRRRSCSRKRKRSRSRRRRC